MMKPFRHICIIFFSLITRTTAMVVKPQSRKNFSRRNSEFYKRRNEGLKIKRGKKPPKWEKEGDLLYREITGNNKYREKYENQKITHSMAQEILLGLDTIGKKYELQKPSPLDQKEVIPSMKDDSPFSWGGLSVGPVWKQRLLKAGFVNPLPIQSEAFEPIAKKKQNVIIASITGSGKSLAYLLPLLAAGAGGGKKATGMVWIITPTLELAVQLRRVVDSLVTDSPLLHIVGYEEDYSKSSNVKSPTNSFKFLKEIIDVESFIFAGTPKVMQQLAEELGAASSTSPKKGLSVINEVMLKKSLEISKNLQTIVLDEADRLLKTETIARNNQGQLRNKSSSKKPRRRNKITNTEKLLRTLITRDPKKKLQFICASATVGRTLRKQLMKITESPSTDKTAVLVTSDIRTKKDAIARKTSLLPTKLSHLYFLLQDAIKNDESTEKVEESSILAALLETLPDLKPGKTLIFPGRLNVNVVQEKLKNNGFKDIRGLDTLLSSKEENVTSQEKQDWKSTPVYVIGEKLGRGLDLPEIEYVLLLQVPSSAAGYTHLAGRTGRNEAKGTVITFCQPREAPKLLMIADTLGLSFSEIYSSRDTDLFPNLDVNRCKDETTKKEKTENRENQKISFAWAALSESAIKRKTIPEIKDYLKQYDITVPVLNDGKRPKKADLISAVEELHDRHGN